MASSDPAVLDDRLAGCKLQGGSYALTVAEATGEVVVDVVFLFLTPDGCVERALGDLAGAMADVDQVVNAGRELVLD